MAQTAGASGFFMIVDVDMNCDHKVSTLRRDKSYCVTRGPIIPIGQFKSVRSLGSAERWAVDVKLTPEGLNMLNKIASSLPQSSFLLVVEGTAVAVFDTNGKCISPITYDDLKWAERHLAKQIKN
ncbi:MAG TPA: hypothetical protein VG737_01475 [Cyclobacteriaceae bacterium]|nr:hypothetical protein [Cyclobacteriaceae bacterium]